MYFNANEQVQYGKADGTYPDTENHGKMEKTVSEWFRGFVIYGTDGNVSWIYMANK